MALEFAFNPDQGETPQTLETKRAIALALARNGMNGVAHNAGEGLAKVGNALAYAMAMGNYNSAATAAQKDYGGIVDSLVGGGGAAPSAAAPAATPAPSQPQIPAAAFSGGNLTDTPAPLSGGKVQPQANAAPQDGGDRDGYAYNFFLKKGYSPVQAAGIVGGLNGETVGLNTTQVHDNGIGYGIAGWNGSRLQNLYNYAKTNNLDPNSLDTQLGFLDNELHTSEFGSLKRLQAAQTPQEAGAATLSFFRPKDYNVPGAHPERAANAAQIFQKYGQSPQSGQPVQVASNDPNFVPQPAGGMNPQLSALLSPNMTVGQGAFSPPTPQQPASGPALAFNGQPPPANPLATPPQANGFAPSPQGQPNITTVPTKPAALPIEGQPQAGRAAVAQALSNQPSQTPTAASTIPPNVAATIKRALMSASPQAQALGTGLLQKYMQPHQYNFATLPDGTVVRQDPLSGTVTPIYQSSKPQFVPNASHDQYGNPIGGFVDPTTQSIKLIGTNGQPVPQGGATPTPNSDLHGEDFLKTIDPGKAETVKGIAEGRIPYPSGFIMKTPYGQWLTQAVGQYEPGIDANIIAQRRKMQTDLSASSPNSIGGILSNGKSAFEHLAELSDKAANLGSLNGYDGPGGGMAAHAGNYIGSVLGTSDTKAKIGAFSQNALKYGQESTKFYAGTGGGEAERMNALKSLDPETSSGSEQAAFLENEKSLMLDRLRQKETQIRDVLGDKYLQQHPVMTPELQKTINRIDGNIAKLRGNGPTSQPAAGAPPKPGNYKFNPATGQLEPQ